MNTLIFRQDAPRRHTRSSDVTARRSTPAASGLVHWHFPAIHFGGAPRSEGPVRVEPFRPFETWTLPRPCLDGDDAQWPTWTGPPSLTLRRLRASGTAASEISIRTQNASM